MVIKLENNDLSYLTDVRFKWIAKTEGNTVMQSIVYIIKKPDRSQLFEGV